MSCKDCQNRTPGCHDTCEDYKEYKRKQEEVNQKRKNEKLTTRKSTFQEERINRYKRRYGK